MTLYIILVGIFQVTLLLTPKPTILSVADKRESNYDMLIAGRYERGEQLGQGGMGTVYQGLDRQTGQKVAIKLLRPGIITSEPIHVARFVREGELLSQLDHPNIVKMLEMAEVDGQTCIVMEYVGGGTLTHSMQQHGPLSIEGVLGIGLEVADALTRAHHLNIVHRDLKPDNVLLAEDDTPRLTDFGLARMQGLPPPDPAERNHRYAALSQSRSAAR